MSKRPLTAGCLLTHIKNCLIHQGNGFHCPAVLKEIRIIIGQLMVIFHRSICAFRRAFRTNALFSRLCIYQISTIVMW